MRWLAFGTLALLLIAAGVLAFIEERDDDRDQTTVRERVEPWRLIGVSADGRTLQLGYDSGGCAHGKARAIVRQSRSAVRIQLRQKYTVGAKPSSELGCTLELIGNTARVRLKRPIGGRHVEGSGSIASRPRAYRRRGNRLVAVVPRVVGLAVGDAVELLGHSRFRTRLRGNSVGTVAAQDPRPGQTLRFTGAGGPIGTVSLTLRRYPSPR